MQAYTWTLLTQEQHYPTIRYMLGSVQDANGTHPAKNRNFTNAPYATHEHSIL
jgi:hypothetical protein